MMMADLLAEFLNESKDMYFLTGTRDQALDLAARLHESGKFFVVTAEGGHLGTKSAVFSHFSVVMQFPSYFGWNWDALNECIRDFVEERRLQSVILIIVEFQGVLRDKKSDLQILCDILQRCGATIVIQCAQDVAQPTLQKLRQAGLADIHDLVLE